jgi:hypothetical protein
MKGEYDRWSGVGVGRVMADAIFGLRSLQRRLRHGKAYKAGAPHDDKG